ncbi:hypothetical protein MPH_07853 [Macrophomina phaseolina MS6]|uniref:Uncharacterized protein n=1 Tax=Macrophomina phaseolina (strain MS6) TaxID=1126212 RepID=K2RJX8_MACPH|nr:hypothetical protein MPH_07853 [Macrophomina phaseolina MS6]
MEAQTPMTPLPPGVEMFQRGKMQSFFAVRSDKPRPVSEATEIFDTDFEDDSSEFEEDTQSPKFSFESNDSRKSQTTISTYDEVPTPHSSRHFQFDLRQQMQEVKPVDGPRGPHLFRSSLSSAEFNYEYALQMSPLMPRHSPPRAETAFRADTAFRDEPTPVPYAYAYDPHEYSDHDDEDESDVRCWSALQVASWMASLGFEDAIIEKFEKHDITGAVLLDMQFEDLKELEISSFGKRHQLWNHIDALRGNDGRVSPVPTPFQDISRPPTGISRTRSTREQSRNRDRSKSRHRRGDCNEGNDEPTTPGGHRKRRGRKHRHGDDVITPAESVSIVAIEQLLPKPHKCAKGERCHKWRKQQRLYQRLQQEHGFPISPEKGGHIFIAGDPGNAGAANKVVDNVYRPTSDALPSVVASSDLLGPGQLPQFVQPTEESLRRVESRDPQENVKQFLNLQHMEPPQMQQYEDERATTPPLEMFPPLQPPQDTQPSNPNLRSLPKLQIPRSNSAQPYYTPQQVHPGEYINTFSPCRTANASPGLYRFGTPASEMDVPLTQVNLGPVSRDVSQSVPPSMQYRDPVQRSSNLSRAADWQRPSFALPPVQEGEVFSPHSDPEYSATTLRDSASGQQALAGQSRALQDHQQAKHSAASSSASDDLKQHLLARYEAQHADAHSQYAGVNHAGWMKKRRTRLLRHEWQDQHFRLTGTRLAMHASDVPAAMALDTIDVDEYAVACSSLASNKLAAKLRGLKLANKKESEGSGPPGAAFTFQLVPTGPPDAEKRVVKKAVAHGKTHHFAVKTRDERIDWMRELMLAKALKAKGEGYEVEVNGNAI